MRAFVTGAGGFVGSYLTRLLVRSGDTVAILARPESSLWRIADVLPSVERVQGDLQNIRDIEPQFRRFAPDTVFHLAWYGVGNEFRNYPEQVARNVPGSVALLRLAMECGSRAWIGLGSQAEYGPRNAILDESAAVNPSTVYGAVKLCTYILAEQLVVGSPLRLVWLRLFSSYGPMDNPQWMIPQLIGTLLQGKKPPLTQGEQKWDYLYVADAAEAIYRTAAVETANGVYNLGSGQVCTIRSIAEQIRDLIDPSLPLGFGEVPYRPDQVMHLQADSRKLRDATGWQPQTSLDDGLDLTVRWHKARSEVDA
jgi:UDP-glucose 4-epimerase